MTTVVAVRDPRLEIKPKVNIALKGADNISYQQFNPNQVSNSSVTVTCNPPSRDIGISRNLKAKATYSVTIAFTNTSGAKPLLDGYWGVRAFPYTSTISSHQLSVGNDIYAVSPVNQWNRAIAHYYDCWAERFTVFSQTATMLDQTQNYADALNTNRNPLAPYSNNSFDQTRNDSGVNGGVIISGLTGNTNGSTSVTFTVTVTEPLMFLSPLSAGFSGFTNNVFFGLDEMTYSATFSNLNRILSISNSLQANVAITSVTTNLTAFSLLFQYLKPKVTYTIPETIVYPYKNYVLYQTQPNVSCAPNASTGNVTTNNLQLTGIPLRIFLWAGPADATYNTDPTSYTTSDTFFALQSLTLTLNTNNYLSQATQQDLYDISVKNGNRLSWPQWSSAMGSVLCLDLGQDIGLNPDEAPGVLKTIQLSITANFKNTNQTLTISPNVYVLVEYDGAMTIDKGFVSRQINTLSGNRVLTAEVDPRISWSMIEAAYGGSWFSKAWDTIKSVAAPLIKPAVSFGLDKLSGVHPALGFARPIVKELTGYGRGGLIMDGGATSGGAYTGGRKKAKKRSRSMRGGSAHMSKEEMMENMEEY